MKSIYKLLFVSVIMSQMSTETSANCEQNERRCFRHCWERHLGHPEHRIHCDRLCEQNFSVCIHRAPPPPVYVEPYPGPYYWGRHHHRHWW